MANSLKSRLAGAAGRKTPSASFAQTSGERQLASKVLFKFLPRDTATGVTLNTADKLQEVLQLGSRTEVIHLALARLAQSTLPQYEADDGPVPDAVLAEIRRRVPQRGMKRTKSLF